MKENILRQLHQSGDAFVSGQSLCTALGVSRQAIWKNITQLKELGYEIESVPKKGYRLNFVPDLLYGPDIKSRLPLDCLCGKVECHKVIESTNIRAKQLAELGEPEGTLVVANQQTQGRGRRGRSWSSEEAVGIAMSLLLRPQLKPVQASSLTLLAGLAVARGIEKVCQVTPQIKWPNDIVLNGKKVCGILTEMSSEMDFIHYAVVGIGINVNNQKFPDSLREIAGSVFLVTGTKTDRQELTAAVTQSFCEYYEDYVKQGDLKNVISEYNRMLANLDQEVQIFHGMVENAKKEEIETGIARGIDAEGALLVDTASGRIKVVSGEVSVRGLYGYV